jgi:uncharacterized membrane protein
MPWNKGNSQPWNKSNRSNQSNLSNQPMLERVIAGICYLTMGLAGLLYIILSGKSNQSTFFRFHFLQSIILGILLFLLGGTEGALSAVLGGIFGLINNPQIAAAILFPISLLFKGVNIVILLALAYGSIWAFLGKLAEVPLISKLVRQQMR